MRICHFPDKIIEETNEFANYFDSNLQVYNYINKKYSLNQLNKSYFQSLFMKDVKDLKIKVILDFFSDIADIAVDFDLKELSFVDELEEKIKNFEINYQLLLAE